MKKIVIDSTEKYSKTALLDDGKLLEVIVENKAEESLVGNVYMGIVQNILPSGFAFVDLGLEKNAFLYLDDCKEADLFTNEKKEKRLRVKQGDTLLVQVLKDSQGSKGPYVTTKISFSGHYAIVAKSGAQQEIGVSKKIRDEKERGRLKALATAFLYDENKNWDIILRTEAKGKDKELADELKRLSVLLQKAEQEWQFLRAPSLAFSYGESIYKCVKELYTDDIDSIVVNDTNVFQQLEKTEYVNKIVLYEDKEPIWKHFFLESPLGKALQERVWLKSGGFLIIQQTEACAVIDVNTGKFTGKKSHEESVVKVNLEAAVEIAYQMRLRNLGGIIIIDFMDMKEPNNVELVTQKLIEETGKDRLSVNVVGMTELGLMQVTRKKARTPLAVAMKNISER